MSLNRDEVQVSIRVTLNLRETGPVAQISEGLYGLGAREVEVGFPNLQELEIWVSETFGIELPIDWKVLNYKPDWKWIDLRMWMNPGDREVLFQKAVGRARASEFGGPEPRVSNWGPVHKSLLASLERRAWKERLDS